MATLNLLLDYLVVYPVLIAINLGIAAIVWLLTNYTCPSFRDFTRRPVICATLAMVPFVLLSERAVHTQLVVACADEATHYEATSSGGLVITTPARRATETRELFGKTVSVDTTPHPSVHLVLSASEVAYWSKALPAK